VVSGWWKAEEIDETIGDSKKVRFHAAEVLACCHRLARIYEEEGVKDDRLSRLYFDCFQVCNMQARLRSYQDRSRIDPGSDF
jgi:hypothetical protein